MKVLYGFEHVVAKVFGLSSLIFWDGSGLTELKSKAQRPQQTYSGFSLSGSN